MKTYQTGLLATTLAAALALSTPVLAREHGIGQPLVVDGLIMRPVYLQPVHMSPMLPGMAAAQADAHVELDIHADKDNSHGFDPGAWIPYLTVTYVITKKDSDWSTAGTMMAMVANDGPHYGDNVKFDGAGKYTIRVRVLPPPYQGFFRHTDKETGVAEWWSPIVHSWDFAYVGVGHKGGY